MKLRNLDRVSAVSQSRSISLMLVSVVSISVGAPALADSSPAKLKTPAPTTSVPAAASTPAAPSTAAAASTPALSSTQTAATPAKIAAPDNLETSLRELHESLRRMKGDVGDIVHEVTRTQQIFPNGEPVSANPWSNNPNFNIYGGMVAQDAVSRVVYLPPRAHWLNNSLAQLSDLEAKLKEETANITKLLKPPACNSATRAQGFVLADVTIELGQDLDALEVLIHAEPIVNAQVNVAAHKIADTIAGMDRVGDRLWKEAPRGLKDK